MGLFSKKKEAEQKEFPSLPQLPKLPKMEGIEEKPRKEPLHQLPSYPPGSLGTKFSHDTIKDAVSGEKSGNSFDEDDMRVIQSSSKNSVRTREIRGDKDDIGGPVFIRIDKFEDALNVFKESKRKISEIEKVLEEIKKVKEKEDKEFHSWEQEVRSMKEKIAKIDRDIFSKV
ncbi:MAG: hypothetical protein WDZ62_00665 [Candidatus Pacearchaeota archaeon]